MGGLTAGIALLPRGATAADDFTITVTRVITRAFADDEGRLGVLSFVDINGNAIGNGLENEQFKVMPLGSYPGALRYSSRSNFVQGPFGQLATTGDFLVVVNAVYNADGTPRSGILFHGGNRPKHSLGCILMGPVAKDPLTGTPSPLAAEHPLRKMRLMFYGNDDPVATPNKNITVVFKETTFPMTGSWRGTTSRAETVAPTTADFQNNKMSLIDTSNNNKLISAVISGLTVTRDGNVSFSLSADGDTVGPFSASIGNDLASLKGTAQHDRDTFTIALTKQ